MLDSRNYNESIKQLKSLIDHGLQSISDLSGNAYSYAKQVEDKSAEEVRKFDLQPQMFGESRLSNLEKMRIELNKQKESQEEHVDEQQDDTRHENVHQEEQHQEYDNDFSDITLPDDEDKTVEVEKETHQTIEERQVEEHKQSDVSIDVSKLNRALTEEVVSGRVVNDIKRLSQPQKPLLNQTDRKIVNAKVVINHIDSNGVSLAHHSHIVDVIRIERNSRVTYDEVLFNQEWLFESADYEVVRATVPRLIEFDDRLKKELTIKYIKLIEDVKENVKEVTNEVATEITKDETPQQEEIKKPKEVRRVLRRFNDDQSQLKSSSKKVDDVKVEVTRRFSRMIKLLDSDTYEEIDRIDQDFEVTGFITSTGFEPINRTTLQFTALSFEIPDGYIRSDRADDIEISVLNPYLMIQYVYVKDLDRIDEEKRVVDYGESTNTEVEKPLYEEYFNEKTDYKEERDDDNNIKRTITRKIELVHAKNGPFDVIVQEAVFTGHVVDNTLKWDNDSIALDAINLHALLSPKNLEAKRDIPSITLKPNSYNIEQSVIVNDQEEYSVKFEEREVIHMCDDEILEKSIQKRQVVTYTNKNDGSIRKEVESFVNPKVLTLDRYKFKTSREFDDRIELYYTPNAEPIEDVLSELPDTVKSEKYTGERVNHDMTNSVIASDRLTSLMKRVRSSDGSKFNDFSYSFKVLGRPVTEEAIADLTLKKIIEEYGSIGNSRVTKVQIGVNGPLYSGEASMRKIKQFIYTIRVICV